MITIYTYLQLHVSGLVDLVCRKTVSWQLSKSSTWNSVQLLTRSGKILISQFTERKQNSVNKQKPVNEVTEKVSLKMEPSEEIVFEDEELKPTLAPVGFDKAVDILSAWIHKKFFAEKSTDDSGFKGDEEEAQSESSEGSKIQFKIKSSTPLRPNVKDFEASLDENEDNEASTSKSDPIFDDYEVVDDEYQEDLDDYQKKLKEWKELKESKWHNCHNWKS